MGANDLVDVLKHPNALSQGHVELDLKLFSEHIEFTFNVGVWPVGFILDDSDEDLTRARLSRTHRKKPQYDIQIIGFV